MTPTQKARLRAARPMTPTRKARLRAARLGRALDKSRPPWHQLPRDPLMPCTCGHSRAHHKGDPLRCMEVRKGKLPRCQCERFQRATQSLKGEVG